ncbi:hypothetical protein N9X02_12035 [Planktomarina temperata]|nr:hypothetical protein [Planktomarina temperata]
MLRNIFTVLTIILASPVATKELKPIALKAGANAYESKAIASAMSERILDTFKYYFEESHFIHGPRCADKTVECRDNLDFSINFRAASVDLNSDDIDEVIVYFEAPGFCGSGGCTSYILAPTNMDDSWVILGEFFPGYDPSISSMTTNKHNNIHYKGDNDSYICRYNGRNYSC